MRPAPRNLTKDLTSRLRGNCRGDCSLLVARPGGTTLALASFVICWRVMATGSSRHGSSVLRAQRGRSICLLRSEAKTGHDGVQNAGKRIELESACPNLRPPTDTIARPQCRRGSQRPDTAVYFSSALLGVLRGEYLHLQMRALPLARNSCQTPP